VIHLGRIRPEMLPGELAISAVTLAELAAGPHHTPDPVERARRISVLQHAESVFDALPFDVEAARAYGEIVAAVLSVGRTPRRRVADQMIAAIAAANQLPLYTTNPKDFDGLGELVESVGADRP